MMVYNLDTKPFWKSLVDDIATVEDISKKLPWFLECNPDRFPYWWVKMIKFPFHSYFEYPSMCDFTVSYTGGLNIFQSYSLFCLSYPHHISPTSKFESNEPDICRFGKLDPRNVQLIAAMHSGPKKDPKPLVSTYDFIWR